MVRTGKESIGEFTFALCSSHASQRATPRQHCCLPRAHLSMEIASRTSMVADRTGSTNSLASVDRQKTSDATKESSYMSVKVRSGCPHLRMSSGSKTIQIHRQDRLLIYVDCEVHIQKRNKCTLKKICQYPEIDERRNTTINRMSC